MKTVNIKLAKSGSIKYIVLFSIIFIIGFLVYTKISYDWPILNPKTDIRSAKSFFGGKANIKNAFFINDGMLGVAKIYLRCDIPSKIAHEYLNDHHFKIISKMPKGFDKHYPYWWKPDIEKSNFYVNSKGTIVSYNEEQNTFYLFAIDN